MDNTGVVMSLNEQGETVPMGRAGATLAAESVFEVLDYGQYTVGGR